MAASPAPNYTHYAGFSSKPSQELVDRFRAHVRATGQPETFPEISTSPTRELGDAIVLCHFQIDRKKRPDRDAAPCPVCSPYSAKYLRGFLVYFPTEKTIRAIGCECGAGLDLKFKNEIQAFRAREKQEAREAYLEDALPTIPTLIAELEDLKRRTLLQRKTWLEFRQKAPMLTQTLRSEMSNGFLRVLEEDRSGAGLGMRQTSGVARHVEKNVAFVVGQEAIVYNFNRHRKLHNAIAQLESVDVFRDDAEPYLVIARMDIKHQKMVEKLVKSMRRLRADQSHRADDFTRFFSVENIVKLNLWGAHPGGPIGFRMELTPNRKCLRITSRSFDDCAVMLYEEVNC